jgi:antitoxin ParD1/3/4
MNVQIDPAQQVFINELVTSGKYASETDVIRAGLRLLQEQAAERAAKLEELRQKIQVGLDQADRGEFCNLSMAEIKAEARREWEASQKGNSGEC